MAKQLKIKVCGMRQAVNVASVAALQPDYMGFIFYEKSPRYVTEVSGELIKYIPSGIKTTGVFVNEEVDTIISLIVKHQLKAVQLHGKESIAVCEKLKQTGVEVIKAFGLSKDFDFAPLAGYTEVVDYFLFDTQTVAHGGSGKVFDWRLLQNYPFDKSYFLSGGIGSEHIPAIQQLKDDRLYAVDVNSKFEIEPALKDVALVKAFIETIRH